MVADGKASEVEKAVPGDSKLTADMKVEILYNNMMGVLETFEFDNQPFAKGMLCIIKPTLFILTAETLDDLQEEVDRMTFATMEASD